MKRVILCPNPGRDRELTATLRAEGILRELGFETVICSPFRSQKEEDFPGAKLRALPAGAQLRLSTFFHPFLPHREKNPANTSFV